MQWWIIPCVMAGLALFFTESVFSRILSDWLQNNRSFVVGGVKNILPYVNYVASLAFLYFASWLYEWQKNRVMVSTGDSPECPRCGSLMRHRRARSGGSYWGCPDCRYRINF